MNIFILHENPYFAATYQCDKHVVKMTLETAQLLCSVYTKGEAPYKRTHYNHPCAVWARDNMYNYEWLLNHGLALGSEYELRYGKKHKSEEVIRWCKDNPPDIERKPFEGFIQCVPDDCKGTNVVVAYRQYYLTYKRGMLIYKNIRGKPYWIK